MAHCEDSRLRPSRPPPPQSLGTTDERLSNIKNLHDESFLYIQQALSCDEAGQKEQAVVLYKKGLSSIDKAMEISIDIVTCTGPHWEEARLMLRKMDKSKVQIECRVADILASDQTTVSALADPPPSYEIATSPTAEDVSWPDSIMDDNYTSTGVRRGSLNGVDGTELFIIPDGVQIFWITPEGYVSAPSYPSALGVYRLDGNSNQGASNVETPPAFLQVGDWSYPLLPGRSPMLRSDWGAYIFPDTTSSVSGSAVGVIIPDSVDTSEKAILEDIFANFTAAATEKEVLAAMENLPALPEEVSPPFESTKPKPSKEQEMEIEEDQEESDRTSTKISKGIVTAAEWIAWGLGKGAEKTGVLLKKGSSELKKRINPEAEPRKVNTNTQKGIYYARQATHGAVKVSHFIVDGLGKATMYIAREAAPHLRKQGEKYLPASVGKKDGTGRSKVDDVMEVAAGGLTGFGTVYMGLEKAAKSLALSIADETVTVVEHRYGKDVGQATENALYATGNLGLTVNNARNLGIKAIAKRTAKDTGKAIVADYKKKREEQTDQDTKEKQREAEVRKQFPSAGAAGCTTKGNVPPRPPPPGGADNGSGASLYPAQQLPS